MSDRRLPHARLLQSRPRRARRLLLLIPLLAGALLLGYCARHPPASGTPLGYLWQSLIPPPAAPTPGG